MPSDGVFQISTHLLRQYLRAGRPQTGEDILADHFIGLEPGAAEIIRFVLHLRSNPRTRRSMQTVRWQWQAERSGAKAAKWMTELCHEVMAMWRQWRRMAFPTLPLVFDPDLTESLSRANRRRIGYTGSVIPDLPSLARQAITAWDKTVADMRGQQVVLWLDNWYCERYGTNPAQPVASTDLSALAFLILSTADDSPASHTRSHSLPPYAGHVSMLHLTIRVPTVAAEVTSSLQDLIKKVQKLVRRPPARTVVRVPLDIDRPARPSLQWRPLTVTEKRVSTNTELLLVLQDLRPLRESTGNVVPLLVDEKVHYAVTRMLLAKSFRPWDLRTWLAGLPLLYGVCLVLCFSHCLHVHNYTA